MMWIYCLVASCLVVGLRATVVEDLMDQWLLEHNQETLANHKESVSIPSISQVISKEFGFFTINAEFKGEGGWLKNMSTIVRTGPLEIDQEDDGITASTSLGLNDLQFGFDSYHASVLGVSLDGTVNVAVLKNSVSCKLTILFPETGSCSTTIDELEIEDVEGFDVQMTGHLASLDWVYSRVAEFIVQTFDDSIKDTLSEHLRTTIETALAENDICNKFVELAKSQLT